MRSFELIPTDGRKSFYGKAVVMQDNTTAYLRSYSTIVGKIENGTFYRCWKLEENEHATNTTLRHINAFLQAFGLSKISKSQFEAMEVVEA